MGLGKQKLENLKKDLTDRRMTIAAGVLRSTAEMIEDEPFFADSVDQAAADTDRAIQVQMQNRERGILFEIDEALRRIDLGTFGECEGCGDEISEGRMSAKPSSTLCIDCAAEVEAERGRIR